MSRLLQLYQGDAAQVIAEHLAPESVDAVITDPPYALEFMGAKWDAWRSATEFQAWCTEWASQCLRVLKPGGHLFSFGGARTWHRLASAVEDAGFEIRDSIAWLHSEGFPKHAEVLKPAHEPIVVARRPLHGTLKANKAQYGTGSLDVHATRTDTGRWPPNVLLDEHAAAAVDEQSGTLTSGKAKAGGHYRNKPSGNATIYGGGKGLWKDAQQAGQLYGDTGGASRFYPSFHYHQKATQAERPKVDGVSHVAVKPLGLMRWLVRLSGAEVVLDPFVGSGTTAEACILEGVECIAIERESAYLPLILARSERAGDTTDQAPPSSPPVVSVPSQRALPAVSL